ncbi:MAG: hypothetical protein AAGM40_25300 [Cyanobacteria bacterium J06573_2]
MSQNKSIENWKKAEYLLIKKRKQLRDNKANRELIYRCYQQD